ncbi:MAG TPA: hypothetical protein VG456_08725 [Candidatus Sulfopaludibacter sp.]|nr:hypothetical protein [Candidatus Sulfopaludibacter sp.]
MGLRGALAVSYATAETITVALAAVLLVLVAIIAYRWWKASRVTPEELERRRRAGLVAYGKMGDAMIVDITGDLVFYSYDVRGMEYTASQDVSLLHEQISGDLSTVGAVSIKYDARNPANSIFVAEQWSGIRFTRAS